MADALALKRPFFMQRGQDGTEGTDIIARFMRTRSPTPDPNFGRRKEYDEIIKTPKKKYDEILAREVEPEDTYRKIDSILAVTLNQPVITLDQLLEAYVSYSMDYRDEKTILDGMSRIATAYAFAEEEFRKLAERDPKKAVRKDGATPLFAHSTRLAVMAAYLGAGSNMIAGLLCHDVIEDCKVQYKTLKKQVGELPAQIVALLTKPKLVERTAGTMSWVYLAGNPKKYEASIDVGDEADYELRIRNHYAYILDNRVPTITAAVKLKSYVGKILDALDNLVSDKHLKPVRAAIRLTVLIGQARHLDVLSPGLQKIMLRLLEERGYQLPSRIIDRPKPESDVIELRLPDKHLSTDYLNRMPFPNGHIIIYADDEGIRKQLTKGTFTDWLKIELPHHAPQDYVERAVAFYRDNGMDVEFKGGLSLLPFSSEASGRIMYVRGINTTEEYARFKELLRGYREVLDIRDFGQKAFL